VADGGAGGVGDRVGDGVGEGAGGGVDEVGEVGAVDHEQDLRGVAVGGRVDVA
jgi:hypothetical protein